MKKIYVAGPFSGQEMRNTRKAVLVGRELIKLGFCPYVPHLSAFIDYLEPIGYEEVMDQCFVWIEVCDGLLFIGSSPGADREKHFALERGIPVFYNIEDLVSHFNRKNG